VRHDAPFAAFDTESAEDFQDAAFGPDSAPVPKIACAATMLSNREEVIVWHGGRAMSRPARCLAKSDAIRLVEYLLMLQTNGYKIVTWNGAGFDFRCLAQVSGMFDECQSLALNHFDMMFHVLCAVGHPVSLAAAAAGLDLGRKMTSSRAIPALWMSGKRAQVLEHLLQDVKMTLHIAVDCQKNRRFIWNTQAGKLRSLDMPSGWRSVHSATHIKCVRAAWNRNDWPREPFIDWLRAPSGE
jgi:hypothetical protein